MLKKKKLTIIVNEYKKTTHLNFVISLTDLPSTNNDGSVVDRMLITSYEGKQYIVHRLFYAGTTVELEIFNTKHNLTAKFPISSIKTKKYNDLGDLEYCEISGTPEFFEKRNNYTINYE